MQILTDLPQLKTDLKRRLFEWKNRPVEMVGPHHIDRLEVVCPSINIFDWLSHQTSLQRCHDPL